MTKHNWNYWIFYLYYIIIFSRNPSKNNLDAELVLATLCRSSISINVKNSICSQHPSSKWATLSTIRSALQRSQYMDFELITTPRNITKLRSFIGLCNFNRSFMPNFSLIADPLTLPFKKYIHAALDPFRNPCSESGDQLIHFISSSPVFALPIELLSYYIYTYERDNQVVAAFLQTLQWIKYLRFQSAHHLPGRE